MTTGASLAAPPLEGLRSLPRTGASRAVSLRGLARRNLIGALGVLVVLSGLAIWKPVQLWWLTDLFYGFQGARWVHFACMTGIVLFLVVHVALALLVPRTIVSMITGNAPHPHVAGPKAQE